MPHASNEATYRMDTQTKSWDEKTRLSFEKDILGFYLSGHPLDRYKDLLHKFSSETTETIKELKSSKSVSLIGVVSAIKEKMTKKGEKMAILSFEDIHGIIEVVVFPKTFAAYESILTNSSVDVLLVKGDIAVEESASRLLATEFKRLEDVKSDKIKTIHIKMDIINLESNLNELKAILPKHKGKTDVTFITNLHGNIVEWKPSTEYRLSPSEETLADLKAIFGNDSISFEI